MVEMMSPLAAGFSGFMNGASDLLSLAQPASNLIFGITDRMNRNAQQKQSQENWQKSYDFGMKQFNYLQQENTLTRAREDTAVQRRVEDLKAAGLNPVLAAGGQGAASAPVSTAGNISPRSNQVASAMNDVDVSQSMIARRMVRAQEAQISAQTSVANSQADLNSALAGKARSETLSDTSLGTLGEQQLAWDKTRSANELAFENERLKAQVDQWAKENKVSDLLQQAATKDANTRRLAYDLEVKIQEFAEKMFRHRERIENRDRADRAGLNVQLEASARKQVEILGIQASALAKSFGFMDQANTRDWIQAFGNLIPDLRINISPSGGF